MYPNKHVLVVVVDEVDVDVVVGLVVVVDVDEGRRGHAARLDDAQVLARDHVAKQDGLLPDDDVAGHVDRLAAVELNLCWVARGRARDDGPSGPC